MATVTARGPSAPSIDDYFIKLWNANAGFLFVLFLFFALILVYRSGDRIATRFGKFFNKLSGSPDAPEKTEYNEDNIADKSKLKNLANELNSAIAPGWFGGFYGSVKCELCSKVMLLNDDEFIYFANYYNRLYATAEQMTLKRQLQDEWDGCGYFGQDYIKQVIDRYSRLMI